MKSINRKHGISLIAVLMFMLAATTASIVVFRYLGEENFLSGARLKQSEAYQASESGLDAVQSWLSNRAADAGELVRQYVLHKKAIFMTEDVLGTVGGSRKQNFKVYLIGVDEKNMPMKLKFLSIGEARDGSKVSQSAIFSVDGLYKISMPVPRNAECKVDFKDAVFGNAGTNTQSNWSNATINSPDYKASQIRTSGDFTASGNVELVSGTYIGLDSAAFANNQNTCPADLTKAGDSYIAGDLVGEQLNFCGNVYVGGNVTVKGQLNVKGDLYVAGNLTLNQNLAIDGNLTIGGNFSNGTASQIIVKGNLLVLPNNTIPEQTFKLNNLNDSRIEGNVWIPNNVVLTGGNSSFKLAANSGSKLYMNNISRKNNTECRYNNNDNIYFSSPQDCDAATPPSSSNQVIGANTLDKLRSRVVEGKVPDPLELPEATKIQWLEKAANLLNKANEIQLVGSGQNAVPPENGALPAACVYLLKTEGNIPTNGYCRSIDAGCSGDLFVKYLSDCYEELKDKECRNANPTYLYKGGDECYLPIKLASNQSIVDGVKTVDGNFIFIFDPKPAILKLPSTTPASKALVYLPEGAGQFQVNGTKGNYFIFSDKDIESTSGNGDIKGTIFMAEGSTIGNIKDTKVTFNDELFQALIDAGILKGTNDPENENCKPVTVEDDYYIPVSSRLSVKLENKKISKEKAPEGANNVSDLEKSILVMPRLVRLAKNELKSPDDFSRYYTYMYLNGATLEDGSKIGPACGELKTNGVENTEGLYTCQFSGTSVRHSDFYVNVSGETGNPKISINPESGEIQKSQIGTPEGCIRVSLTAEEENPVDSWQVMVSVDNGGYLWNVQPIDGSCSDGNNTSGWLCLIPKGRTSANVLNVCPMSNAADNEGNRRDQRIVLKIAHSTQGGYQIHETRNTSTITISSETSRVQRDPPPLQNGSVECPFPPESWVSVDCPDFMLLVPNDKWRCEAGEVATWNVNAGDACNVIGSSNNATSGNIIVSPQEELNHFTVGLEWKSYNLTVSGLDATVNITTSNPNVPENKRTLSCYGTTGCDIYHGASYTVYRTGNPVEANCTASFCPGNPIYLGEASGISLTGTLTPTGHVEIVLKNIDPPVVTGCVLTQPQQKIGGNFTMSNIVEVISSGYGCDNKTVKYSIAGTQYIDISGTTLVSIADAGPYDVSVKVTCNNQESAEKTCNNQLQGVPALPPSISCISEGSTIWSIDSKPKVKVTVTNGETVLCGNASITGYGWTWMSGTTQNQNYGESTNYIFEKSTPITEEGSYSVTANVACGGPLLEAPCPEFTVTESGIIEVTLVHNGAAYDFEPGKTYTLICTPQEKDLVCGADGAGKTLTNGTTSKSTESWWTLNNISQAIGLCKTGNQVTVTGGIFRCKNAN